LVSRFDKQKAIKKLFDRSVKRMNNNDKMKEDAERFGHCNIGIVITDFYGRLGDFHGSYSDGKFSINLMKQSSDNYDAVVTISENAFMSLCRGLITPTFAYGVGEIQVTGRLAYKLMVVGIAVGELLYDVLNDD